MSHLTAHVADVMVADPDVITYLATLADIPTAPFAGSAVVIGKDDPQVRHLPKARVRAVNVDLMSVIHQASGRK